MANTDSMIELYTRTQLCPRTHSRVLTNPNIRANPNIVTKNHVIVDDSAGVYSYILAQLCRSSDDRRVMQAARTCRTIIK